MQLWVVQVQALALILFTLTSKYAFGTLNYVVGETTRKGFEIMIEIPVFTREEHHTLQILRKTEQIEVRMGITADGHTEHASVSAAGMTGMGTGLVGDRDLRELLAIDYGGLVTTPFK